MDCIGNILRVDGTNCLIYYEGNIHRAYLKKRIRGAHPEEVKPITVGDYVVFEKRGEQECLLKEVLPRKTWLIRKAVGKPGKRQVVVANVEQILILSSIAMPPFHPGIIDRFLVAAGKGKLKPIIVVNKWDLHQQEPSWMEIQEMLAIYAQLQYPVFLTSIFEPSTLQPVHEVLQGHSTVLAGHSGVGKSSLLSAIDPSIQLKTNDVNPKSQKGRHTTTSVSIFPIVGGGFVVDTPGIREFTLWQMYPWELSRYFPEIAQYASQCKYKKCTHTHEPDCAVKIALEECHIADFRYQSYCRILDSILHPDDVAFAEDDDEDAG